MEKISLTDFDYSFVEGTSSSSADTQAIFRHGRNKSPSFWLVLEGDVYVPKDGMGPNTLDVRSRNASEKFKLLLIF